jgi:hypothetical protein
MSGPPTHAQQPDLPQDDGNEQQIQDGGHGVQPVHGSRVAHRLISTVLRACKHAADMVVRSWTLQSPKPRNCGGRPGVIGSVRRSGMLPDLQGCSAGL